ncbi:hypothetical protein MEM_02041 [Candida albicans L26]|uniref:F1F0 ATP synthase subunit h n=5 Tax=Candida TaxID=5475 RepID=A0A1D8PHL7_CANAL|nr:F1F0 ATP synthase subunit h [Candida albicans SC5314]EEQ46029.1 predicted protein [Candida albicans WO-1]KAF6063584.1 ATP synthase complex subunit h family protein [Candida albicans]KAG8204004.1 ATP14 [Candida africana]KGQ89168.1 hypothetical protein MEO_02029 [Candida albicans P94015]KGQ96491.1 hypothetical protein MEU_02029 [Candida albicans P37005]KGR00235.1 hypothetical protein MG1_02059 [Candida albicans GC75]KGR13617.1 hypothetical protein MG3_02046 [Candida albicans P78048]KGR2097|eukprot:XP_019330789.1 F1F0 ATP synthase subunit h [Candida albicans SC5314]
MFRPVARLSSRRLFSVTPRRSNLIGDLYIQHIKAFKPKALTQADIDSAVKAFQLPAKPSVPQADVNAEAVKEYEASDVETASPSTVAAEQTKPDEDWFVFEEVEEAAH